MGWGTAILIMLQRMVPCESLYNLHCYVELVSLMHTRAPLYSSFDDPHYYLNRLHM